ncbi:AAA family ATPase [Antrihabitans stalactiti]|uniref:AAA domain-containing protein n=1 Tax=Antrihabitans stalactiti TaxID=2584121 RepID=A0A848KEY9_9NOCA|nr:AAA family ATPase [Antrihabitans stalactiti]NMN94517.1 hypothetical protein [Antrihabitans stalactiti]
MSAIKWVESMARYSGLSTPAQLAAYERAAEVERALQLFDEGWETPEKLIAAVEAACAAGLYIGLVHTPASVGTPKSPVSREICLSKEQQESDEFAGLDGMELYNNDPARVFEMVVHFQERFGAIVPNFGVELHRSRLLVVDADTPTQVRAFQRARKIGDPKAVDHGLLPTVKSPGSRNDDGTWKHERGGHWYYALPDGVDGGYVKVEITGTGESWVIIGNPNQQVVLPGSVRKEGRYCLVGGVGVVRPWLTAYLDGSAPKGHRAKGVGKPSIVRPASGSGTSAIDAWARGRCWTELLGADGWTQTGRARCGDKCVVWKHATASSERSGVAHAEGCSEFDIGSDDDYPLHVFSDSHPVLEGGGTYTKYQYALTVHYGGDTRAFSAGESLSSFEDPEVAGVMAALRAGAEKAAAEAAPAPETGCADSEVPSESNEAAQTTTDRPSLYTPKGESVPTPLEATASVEPASEPAKSERPEFLDGAEFVLDAPDIPPAWWGSGSMVLAARGESTMLCGSAGLGKTTIEAQLVRASLGFTNEVLGQPVAECSRVLVLAMDRPQQISRAFKRIFTDADRAVLAERLVVRQGPPEADIAVKPELLLQMCQKAGLAAGDRVFVDSLKDAALGLSDDQVAGGYNRARQRVLAAGIDVFELHHMVKRSGDGSGPPKALADVYGSTWLTAGAGSVFVFSADAGDVLVHMAHLKQPMHEFGPLNVVHDHETGFSTIDAETDLFEIVRGMGTAGITAKDAALVLFGAAGSRDKERNNIDKARRKLQALAKTGSVIETPGSPGGGTGRTPTTWMVVPFTGLALVPPEGEK